MATISFNVGKTISISHNNRDNAHGNEDIKTDKIEDNIYYIQKDIQEIYHEEFDDVVEKYNVKQKRADRKIEDYYSKVLHDKKTEHHREIIVAIGESQENVNEGVWESKKDILDEYAKTFQDRNPNLKVYNMVQHLDEANPHLHITYVPVADYSRGLEKRVANNKALEQQGYDSFADWRIAETSFLEEQMNNHDLERDFKGSHAYFSVNEYKELKEAINTLETSKNELKEELSTIESVDMDKIVAEPQVFNKERLTISKQDFELVQDVHSKATKVLAREHFVNERMDELYENERNVRKREIQIENRGIELDKKEIELEKLTQSQKALNDDYKILKQENKDLKKQNSELKDYKDYYQKLIYQLADVVSVVYHVAQNSKNEVLKEMFTRLANGIPNDKLKERITGSSGLETKNREVQKTETDIQNRKYREKNQNQGFGF